MSKVNEVLLHITTDITYVSQDALNADGDLKNFYDALATQNNANQSTNDGAAQ